MIVNNRIFAALGSLARRQMMAALAQSAASTSTLAERFGMSPPAISRHLSVLEHAGLVARERQGQQVLYRLQRHVLLDALARFAHEVDGPLRRDPQTPHNPRNAL
jgi:DNA-binding transcriptional ArsR family regulator